MNALGFPAQVKHSPDAARMTSEARAPRFNASLTSCASTSSTFTASTSSSCLSVACIYKAFDAPSLIRAKPNQFVFVRSLSEEISSSISRLISALDQEEKIKGEPHGLIEFYRHSGSSGTHAIRFEHDMHLRYAMLCLAKQLE